MEHKHYSYLGTVFPVIAIIITTSVAFFSSLGDNDVAIGRILMSRAEHVNTPCISALQIDLEDPIEIAAANRSLSLIKNIYPGDYYNSSISHHHFIRTAPEAIQETLSKFVWSDSALKQVRTNLATIATHDATCALSRNNGGGGGVRVIRDVFDEIYIMRPEFDLLDEKKVHYDGNLKLPGICTIRALTYLSGKDATLVALTSGQSYTTRNHTSIVLDFDRELHYVSLNPNLLVLDRPLGVTIEGRLRPEPRVMIKAAIHVVLPGTNPLVAYFRIMLHRTMVFAARSARRTFESKSKSKPDALSNSNMSMMAVDNLMRSMNKIHMILPVLLIGLPLGTIFLAPVLYPFHFLPYVALIIARCMFYTATNQVVQLCNSWLRFLVIFAASCILVYKSRSGSFGTKGCKMTNTMFRRSNASTNAVFLISPDRFRVDSYRLMLFHIAWVGVCYYIESNAEMANKMLLAPWQQVTNLDDII